MDLQKTKGALERINKKDKLFLNDVLGLIASDIVDDLENYDMTIQSLPLGIDQEQEGNAILYLSNLARMVGRIYKKNAAYIDSSDFRKNWEGASKKLLEVQADIEKTESIVKSNKEILKDLERKKQELKEVLATDSELQKKIEDSRLEISKLTAQIDDLNMKIEEQKTLKDETEKAIVKADQEYKKWESDAKYQIQEMEHVKKQIEKLEVRYSVPLKEVQSRKNQLMQAFSSLKENESLFSSRRAEGETADELAAIFEHNFEEAKRSVRVCEDDYEKILRFVEKESQ